MSANDLRDENLAAEFLDDFYAECDEHLVTIREGLVALENGIGTLPDTETVQRLFRAFHSVKGNSGIVGLQSAEKLAHAAEDFLREIGRNSAPLSQKEVDLLMGASQALEQIIASHRTSQPAPDVSALLTELAKTSQVDGTTGKASPSPALVDPASHLDPFAAARAKGLSLWTFTFNPTKELDQTGVNINSIRSQLSGMGEILKASPEVKPGGTVTFTFIVALASAPEDLASWEQQGVNVAPVESVEPPASASSAASAGTEAKPAGFVAPSHVLRVDLNRLDELMRITGEMVIVRAQLEDQINRAVTGNGKVELLNLQEINASMGRALRELRECVMRVRLVPVAEIFSRMPFVIRDLTRETGKKIRLSISGQQTEIDKYLVERLKDPLLHLARNSVSHGIESIEERSAAGKPPQGTIFLLAAAAGDSVQIEIGDDGRGIDVEAVNRRAKELGLPAMAADSGASLLALLCRPGFSTRQEADRGSGRGVGMDVVQNTINELGGQLALENTPGRGVRFRLRLPLTLAIADVFIVSAREQNCAVPQNFVHEILLGASEQVQIIGGQEFLPYRKSILPLIRLRHLFKLQTSEARRFPVMVINSEAGSVGLAVDRIQGQREVVVRPLRDPLVQGGVIAGATELGDGRPVLILNGAALTTAVVRPRREEIENTPPLAEAV